MNVRAEIRRTSGAGQRLFPLFCRLEFGISLFTMNDDFIARKERWAEKMAGRKLPCRSGSARMPPGQHEVKDFPVLDLGVKPRVSLEEWRLNITGEVENPVSLDWEALMALPQFTDVSDFHCVTTWSQLEMEWTGVAFFSLADLVLPKQSAQFVLLQSFDGYTTNLDLAACLDEDVLIAHSWGGQPLSLEHGGPARLVVPKRYAWKSAKWLREIRFSSTDALGYWEKRGYSNYADPFINDRFCSVKKSNPLV